MEFHATEQVHLAECARLFAEVFNNPPWKEGDEVVVARRLEDCFRTPGFSGLLVKMGGEVAGFAIGCTERWDKAAHFCLKEMCVATGQQRRGIGTALMNQLEAMLKEDGVAKLYLRTARDTEAQAFYGKQGFYVSPRMIMMPKWLEAK